MSPTRRDLAGPHRGRRGDGPPAPREAILGVIAAIDRPASPAGEGRQHFVGDLMGYGPAVVNAYRAHILQVTVDDIRRAAETWLRPGAGTEALVTSGENLAASGLGWEAVAL